MRTSKFATAAAFTGVFGALSIVAFFTATVFVRAAEHVPQQAQASNLAVPAPPATPTPRPASALAVSSCKKLVALLVIDTAGGIHPFPLEGATEQMVTAVLASVPQGKAVGLEVPCHDAAG